MADFTLVEIRGWEYDLQSVYTAYMGYFQLHGIPWYERSWGHLFESFEDFLSFSWPVITITDVWTGRAHIVTRMTSIGAFLKMIKTRFGETLPLVENFLKIEAFEKQQRHLRTITDYTMYKKLHATLPAVVLSALKMRIRSGDPRAVSELWAARDKTFISMDFESSERNAAAVLEWGYAAVRCGHLESIGSWPPIPEDNYRKGHYIVGEYVDKVRNRYHPTFPYQYAFGDSMTVPKAKLSQIIQAVISSLASPDSEMTANSLVFVSHSVSEDIHRMEEMRIRIPHNMLIVDVVAFESALFKAGRRGAMLDARSGQPRLPGSTLSLSSLVLSLGFNVDYAFHNSGNDAFACLLAFQKLLDPENTKSPGPRPQNNMLRSNRAVSLGPMSAPPFQPAFLTPPMMTMSPMARAYSASPRLTPSDVFGQSDMQQNRHKAGHSLTPDNNSMTSRRASHLGVDEQGKLKHRSSVDMLSQAMARNTIA
ncbi:hypothetical protein DENSPDRAFT_373661 [Dentipellis sp. KUC8613]|nr:hypothetical protein DENSPDRAFT_373661 [Dentipellis sp. KUC8613]